MHMIDFLLIIFCIFCLIRGVLRGTVNETFSIAGIFIGLIVASAYYIYISLFIFSWISNPQMRQLWGFLISFGFIYLAINLLGIMVTYFFHIAVSGWGSRITGAGIGTIKGLLFISVLLIPLVTFSPKGSKYIKNSTMFSLEAPIAEQMIAVTSKKIQKTFTINIGDYEKSWGH